MLLSKATYSAFSLYIFISMCVPWELNPQPFALLTQCSTTEPQEQEQILSTLKASAFIYDHRHIKTWINQLISLQCKVCRLPLTVLHILNLTTAWAEEKDFEFRLQYPFQPLAAIITYCTFNKLPFTQLWSHNAVTCIYATFECVLDLYILYTVTLVIGSPELDLNTRCKNEVYAWYLGTFYQLLVCYINKATLFSQDKTFLVFMQQPDWVFQHCNSQRPRLK